MADKDIERRRPKRSSQSIGGVTSTSGSTVVPSNNNQVKIRKGVASKKKLRVVSRKRAQDRAKVTVLKQTQAEKRSGVRNQRRTIAKTNVRKELATPVGSRRALPSLFGEGFGRFNPPPAPLPFVPAARPVPQFNDLLTRRLQQNLTPPPPPVNTNLRGGLPGGPAISSGPQFTNPNIPPWFRR